MRSKVLQLRLDKDLAHSLAAYVGAAKRTKSNSDTAVVRLLVREVLAARQARLLPVAERGFVEVCARAFGWLLRIRTHLCNWAIAIAKSPIRTNWHFVTRPT